MSKTTQTDLLARIAELEAQLKAEKEEKLQLAAKLVKKREKVEYTEADFADEGTVAGKAHRKDPALLVAAFAKLARQIGHIQAGFTFQEVVNRYKLTDEWVEKALNSTPKPRKSKAVVDETT